MFADFRITLAAARVNAGLTQQQLADTLGVDKSTVYSWENGKGVPNANHLRKISELSQIPMDYIFVPSKTD
jgi:DNA-binding XRE family transcriptional regulator